MQITVEPKNNQYKPSNIRINMLLYIFLIISLILSGFKNFLLFHTVVELFTVIIAFSITVISINSYHASENKFFLFLGIAYGFVGGFDLLHTLAYEGMGVIPNANANQSTQLWIIARYLESISILVSSVFLVKKLNLRIILGVYTIISLLAVISVFHWGIFPVSFVEGVGLTPFKITSEYLISGILAISIVVLVRNKSYLNPAILNYLIWAYATTIAAELSFTLYTNVDGFAIMLGHVFKAVSFYFIYLAIVKTNLELPYLKLEHAAINLKQEMEKRKKEEKIRRQMEEHLLTNSKLDSIGTLAGGIAHDFNNLLTVIRGNVSLVKNRVANDSKVFPRIIEIEKASLQAAELTKQLMAFAKGGEPVKKTVAINDIIRETVALALSGSNARCELHLADQLALVDLDEGQFKQVINNLVINAYQAMPTGGVIKITTGNVLVNEEPLVSFLSGEKYIRISITDKGMGIAPQNLAKVFDPFFTTKESGNGLGLASSFSIINKHDGYITVDSKVGNGTTFNIYLPTSANEQSVKIEMPKANVEHVNGKVLVMDDDPAIRQVYEKMLLELGYTVDFAQEGKEAIDLFLRANELGQPFDLVILDLTIPGGMGGEDTAQNLIKINPAVKLVFSSGYAENKIIDVHLTNISYFLQKPFNIDELSKALHHVLAPARTRNL